MRRLGMSHSFAYISWFHSLAQGNSKYNELIYTTPILANIPDGWCKNAALISTEKQTPDTGHEDGGDEETNPSRVLTRADHGTQETQSEGDSVIKKFARRKSSTIPPSAKGHIRGITKSHQKGREKTTPRKGEPTEPNTPHLSYHDYPSDMRTQVSAPEILQETRAPAIIFSQYHPGQRECPAENCIWTTPANGGQWQSYYNHVAYRHGNNISSEWWAKEGRFHCNACGRHCDVNKLTSHSKHCKGQVVKAPPPSQPLECLGEAIYDVQGTDSLPPLETVCTTPISTCKDVPHRCRQLWAKILTTALSSVVHENSARAWTLLAMLLATYDRVRSADPIFFFFVFLSSPEPISARPYGTSFVPRYALSGRSPFGWLPR